MSATRRPAGKNAQGAGPSSFTHSVTKTRETPDRHIRKGVLDSIARNGERAQNLLPTLHCEPVATCLRSTSPALRTV